MNGIAVQICRDASQPDEKENVYLSTRRSGEAGKALSKKKRDLRKKQRAVGKLSRKMLINNTRLEKFDEVDGDLDDLTALTDAGGEMVDQVDVLAEEVRELELDIVRRSLKENHGKDTEAILDCFTTSHITQALMIIETGDVPKDFFMSPVTPPEPTTTSSCDSGASESSLVPDTPAKPGKKGE